MLTTSVYTNICIYAIHEHVYIREFINENQKKMEKAIRERLEAKISATKFIIRVIDNELEKFDTIQHQRASKLDYLMRRKDFNRKKLIELQVIKE